MCCAVVSHPVMSDSLEPTPWTAALQAPLSTGILQARILEWVLPCPSQGDLPNPGIELRSPALQGVLYSLSHRGSPSIAISVIFS